MTGKEVSIFLLVRKERRKGRKRGRGVKPGLLLQTFQVPPFSFTGYGRAVCNEEKGIIRAYSLCLQHIIEGKTKIGGECQGASKIQHIAFYLPTLGKPCHCLVHYSVVDGSCNVFLACPLIQKRLYIAFGKDSTAGSYYVAPAAIMGHIVHYRGRYSHELGHLVDECACTSGTASVHPYLNSTSKEEDLGVLSSQLYDHIAILLPFPDSCPGGIDLLDKGN